jgi:general secretion pathway protein L
MTFVLTRFPTTLDDDPTIFRISEGVWEAAGPLSAFVVTADDTAIMAVVAPQDVRNSWFTFPELEARQAMRVAKLRACEESIGPVHCTAGVDFDGSLVTAAIAPEVMQYGLDRLTAQGVNPDIVIPLSLVLDTGSDGYARAELDGVAVLRGPGIAIPDEKMLRDIFVGADKAVDIEQSALQAMLLSAGAAPVLNMREGMFAKREGRVWTTSHQRMWILRILLAIFALSVMTTFVTLGRYWSAISTENETALVAAQKIDPSIQDITQVESALVSALNRKGIVQGSFAPLSAALWRNVKASPNVSVRELRFTPDGILSVVLAGPTADNINKTLLGIQQDGFRITATPRQDASGSTLVDITMRMP